jgi:Tetratricopeptide repeat
MNVHRTALALALLLVPAVASAQSSDADKATARVLAQQGQDALDKKDFPTAADRFERARQLYPAPTLAVALARAQIGMGKWIAAQETLNRVLREGSPAGSPPAYAKAVLDARKELDVLEPRIPSVIINVKGPPTLRVTIDGALVPSAALGVNRLVDPGAHTVRAEAEGFASAQATVNASEHQVESVALVLVPGAASPPPVEPPHPPPSTPPPSSSPPPASPPPASGGSTLRTVGFVGIGVGAAGLVMGAVTGGLAVSKHGDLATGCQGGHCPPSEYGALDSYHLMTNLSDAGLVVGGVLAAAGVVLVVTAPKPGRSQEAWVAPIVGPGYLGAQGRF